MAKWGFWLAAVALSGAAIAGAQSSPPAPGAGPRFGTIAGRVSDPRGVVQSGIPVTITSRDGRFVEKIFTQASGRFALPRLAPGVYSVEVLLPTFLPFWKAPILVLPGAQVLLDINLRSLADSVAVRWPDNPAEAREEWMWVLRSGAPPRHILRFQEETAAAAAPPDPREHAVRGTVQFWAGNDSRSFGSDPGLRTTFDMEYGAGSANGLGIAGSAGWEQGTPAASFRTAWNRRIGDDTTSTFSATLRQVFLPGEYWRSLASPGGTAERLQSMSFGYEHENAPSERLRVRYGALLDTLSLGERMIRWSPFGRITYSHSDSTRLSFFYAGTAPRVLPSDGELGRQKADRWLAIPQLSSGGNLRPTLESGRHLEAAWEQQWGAEYRLQAGAFYDSLSEVALSLAAAQSKGFLTGLLRDPFSNRYFLSGGSYSGPGARASFSAKLFRNSEVAVGYSYAGGLQVASSRLRASGPQALRELVHARRGHSFTVKVTSKVPRLNTQVVTSYRWLPRHSVVTPDPYDQGMGRAEPFLNVVLLQPLPSPNILPGQFQAVADFSNLIAQGYLPIQTPDGGRALLFPAARSFRGGFNFIF
ncbi:MAG: hypothetical protein A3H28_10360 [Acidobacteria bacterium RIFCSPLOWO2_02_FULL_61_28]|nr:MAG: hypothetical protein A3H28_10360 [Acidobacteria bacterium RIFCSPLOWO2_02_FULL_61_28]